MTDNTYEIPEYTTYYQTNNDTTGLITDTYSAMSLRSDDIFSLQGAYFYRNKSPLSDPAEDTNLHNDSPEEFGYGELTIRLRNKVVDRFRSFSALGDGVYNPGTNVIKVLSTNVVAYSTLESVDNRLVPSHFEWPTWLQAILDGEGFENLSTSTIHASLDDVLLRNPEPADWITVNVPVERGRRFQVKTDDIMNARILFMFQGVDLESMIEDGEDLPPETITLITIPVIAGRMSISPEYIATDNNLDKNLTEFVGYSGFINPGHGTIQGGAAFEPDAIIEDDFESLTVQATRDAFGNYTIDFSTLSTPSEQVRKFMDMQFDEEIAVWTGLQDGESDSLAFWLGASDNWYFSYHKEGLNYEATNATAVAFSEGTDVTYEHAALKKIDVGVYSSAMQVAVAKHFNALGRPQVSTTEPELGNVGDQWFNPETGTLSIYTEDS